MEIIFKSRFPKITKWVDQRESRKPPEYLLREWAKAKGIPETLHDALVKQVQEFHVKHYVK